MRARAEVTIPAEATISDVRAVADFLTGFGSCEWNLKMDSIRFEWGLATQGEEPNGIALVALEATAEMWPQIRQAPFEIALVRALDLIATWEEIVVELRSRGWSEPKAVRYVPRSERR